MWLSKNGNTEQLNRNLFYLNTSIVFTLNFDFMNEPLDEIEEKLLQSSY